jgi:hypothetical protein
MKKIISLFQRNYDGDRLVRDEIVPGAEWVVAGDGVATRKWDGTCCMIRGGVLYKRYDAKQGKTPPPGFEPAQEPDPVSGHHPGWLPVGDRPDDRWFREAFAVGECLLSDGFCEGRGDLVDGTYELCGPKINRNPEGLPDHILVRHGAVIYPSCPRTFDAIRDWLSQISIEGIVWHRADGSMVKIKKRDFGLTRNAMNAEAGT